jgi:hypothetical protein
MLKLSTFNAQRFERNYSSCVQVGALNIYIVAVEVLRKKKKDRVKLRKPSKLITVLMCSNTSYKVLDAGILRSNFN